jgi:hypothetical protein
MDDVADAESAEMQTDEEGVTDIDEVQEVIPYRYAITSYGADFLVDGLVNRLQSGDIIIPTFDPEVEGVDLAGFQRAYVWTKSQADRFIESLLLGLPVPGIFLVSEVSTDRLLVLDGQQRLRTLASFYAGILRGQEFRLRFVQSQFVGMTYADLDPEDRRRLDNSIIHATILRQDQPTDDQSSIYLIFERLNTGGTILQPQEIRVALYRGQLVRTLRELNDWPAWRTLYGPPSTRLKDQELILRFFALLYAADDYQRPMKEFLNKYMAHNRDLEEERSETLAQVFHATTDAILAGIGDRAFRPRVGLNAAVMDSIMVGVARRILNSGPIKEPKLLAAANADLQAQPDYRASVESTTSYEESVRTRLELAKKSFATVQ